MRRIDEYNGANRQINSALILTAKLHSWGHLDTLWRLYVCGRFLDSHVVEVVKCLNRDDWEQIAVHLDALEEGKPTTIPAGLWFFMGPYRRATPQALRLYGEHNKCNGTGGYFVQSRGEKGKTWRRCEACRGTGLNPAVVPTKEHDYVLGEKDD